MSYRLQQAIKNKIPYSQLSAVQLVITKISMNMASQLHIQTQNLCSITHYSQFFEHPRLSFPKLWYINFTPILQLDIYSYLAIATCIVSWMYPMAFTYSSVYSYIGCPIYIATSDVLYKFIRSSNLSFTELTEENSIIVELKR